MRRCLDCDEPSTGLRCRNCYIVNQRSNSETRPGGLDHHSIRVRHAGQDKRPGYYCGDPTCCSLPTETE